MFTDEISNRIPVWTALSEFYIDTELNHDDLSRIKKVFIDSGQTLDDIKKIDIYEVFPLLQTNLLSPAGTWAGFDDDWLIKECIKRHHRRRFFLYRLTCRIFNRIFFSMRKRYWTKIESL